MSKILIINTGGTISMVASSRGYVPDGAGFAEKLRKMERTRSFAVKMENTGIGLWRSMFSTKIQYQEGQ